MPKYIDADKLKERLMVGSELDPEPCKGFRSALLAMVDSQEDADVRENVHAEWLPYEFGNERWHKCSACGKADEYINERGIEAVRKFCPNCGAQMDERRTE